jgi:hypothetical protein
MTQQEIIETARQAGFAINELHCSPPILTFVGQEEAMEAFAKLVAEKERERISQKIAQLPFGDTAQSLSIWVKNDT